MVIANMQTFFIVGMNMKTSTLIFAALAGALALSTAHASPVPSLDVTFNNNIFSGSGSYAVTIHAPAATGSGVFSEAVLAGRFQGVGSNVKGVSDTIFVQSLNNLYMYCYDIYQNIYGGAKATYTIDYNGETARTLQFLGAVNQVLNVGKKTADPFAWLKPVDGDQGAAIQLGIWESLYDKKGWDIYDNKDGGVFWTTGLANSNSADAQETRMWWSAFSQAIGTARALDARYVMVLRNPNVQDMITGDPPATVPEPGLLGLLGLGLGGLFLTRRKASA